MNDNLTAAIGDLISDTLVVPRDQVTDNFTYGDIPEWDSMGHMTLMMALEENFNIQITADTITNLVSIPAIISYLSERKEND
jgi:acyl carrier protein